MRENQIKVSVENRESFPINQLEEKIFEFNDQIKLLSSQGDEMDYLVSVGSGLLSSVLDVMFVGQFDLNRGKEISQAETEKFVTFVAKTQGYEGDNLKGAVSHLEKNYHIPSDGNTPDFGGGRQHHIRDFAHHPTAVGLSFSILTQFTGNAYGRDTDGNFIVVPIPNKHQKYIGEDVSSKILYGVIHWFFHLVSDLAGSSGTIGEGKMGTGIPGPILALAQEVSVLPFFKDIKIKDKGLSLFCSKLFNGTLLAQQGEDSKIIKGTEIPFDFRSEMGVGVELGRQAIPVLANECIVRIFYFIRRLAMEVQGSEIKSIDDFKKIDWDKVKPANNPTVDKMLLVATGVFTTVDISDALARKSFVSVNIVGVGRFVVAMKKDVSWTLKMRDIKRIKQMYENIKLYSYVEEDDNILNRMGDDFDIGRLGFTAEQVKILYNIEYHKTQNDIHNTKDSINKKGLRKLKSEWLKEWKGYITENFSNFLQVEGVEMQWYMEEELNDKIANENPQELWFKLVLLEAMIFKPYFSLSAEEGKKGELIISKKYKKITNNSYKESEGDYYLEQAFSDLYFSKDFIKKLRKSYEGKIKELTKSKKSWAKVALALIGAGGAGVLLFINAPAVAILVVGSKFAGLSGVALVNASLAYLGGGALAAGGLGMAGGAVAIAGGGAVLGLGAGIASGKVIDSFEKVEKGTLLVQLAKLLVTMDNFLNDEGDIVFSKQARKEYVRIVKALETQITELKVRESKEGHKGKKKTKSQIKSGEECIEMIKAASDSMEIIIDKKSEKVDICE